MEYVKLHDKTFEPYFSPQEIDTWVNELGTLISVDYKDKKPLLIAVLNGAFMFASDLMKKISIDCEISFIKSTSYQGIESTGNLNELIGLNENIDGRHVIVVEDIVDTGNSMFKTLESLKSKNPASIEVCTLLFKPEALQHSIPLKYIGKSIPNDFVVGYGLDYDGLGRNLDAILKLKA